MWWLIKIVMSTWFLVESSCCRCISKYSEMLLLLCCWFAHFWCAIETNVPQFTSPTNTLAEYRMSPHRSVNSHVNFATFPPKIKEFGNSFSNRYQRLIQNEHIHNLCRIETYKRRTLRDSPQVTKSSSRTSPRRPKTYPA